jgi:hypothetical protein
MTIRQDKRYRAEVEIIKNEGEVPSCRRMQKLLKEKYGIEANFTLINQDLKKDLETLTKEEYKNQKHGILDMLDTEINIAHEIVLKETDNELRLKAMNSVSKLSKTKADILIKFKKAQAQLSSAERPIIEVSIGQPKEVDLNEFKKIGDKKNEKTE